MQVPRLGTGLWALLLSAAILLAACGDDDGSDLQVRASVDGEDVVASPIGADAEEAIEVPSGSLLELDAKAAVTLSTDSDAATIETASPERHKVRFVSPGGATVVLRVASLADGGTARLTVRVLPQRFDNHFRRAGQRLSYRVVKRGLDGKVASETGEIDRVGSVATNGDYTLVLADYSTPTQGEYYVVFFDADGNELGYDFFVLDHGRRRALRRRQQLQAALERHRAGVSDLCRQTLEQRRRWQRLLDPPQPRA